VREPRRAEADLRHAQTVARPPSARLVVISSPSNSSLAVPAVLLRPHDRDAPGDAPSGLVRVEQEGGEALAVVVEVRAMRMKCFASAAPVM
jgi:hypothetical protein